MNESLSIYQTVDVIISASGQFDSLFNYWISASFAVIVSAYIAKSHFNGLMTVCISILYFLASMMFLSRFYSLATLVIYYTDVASESLPPDFADSLSILGFTRGVTFIFGFLVTEFYLWLSYTRRNAEASVNT